jgi:hypothetical protein
VLSPEVQARLTAARSAERSYRPNEQICAKLHEKTLVMFVGPVAIGKSFLMNHLVKADASFSRVPVFTTRDSRPDDEPGMFRTAPHDDAHVSALLDKIDAREVVQYAVHPTDRLYGSTINDYPNEFNLLAALSTVVDSLSQLPFKKAVVIGLSVRPDVWTNRLNNRYPQPSSERTKRLQEAVASLDWLLAKPDMQWVDNTASDPTKAIQSILNIVKYSQQTQDTNATTYARQMRDSIVRIL